MNQSDGIISTDSNKIHNFYLKYIKDNHTSGWPSMESAREAYEIASNSLDMKWTEFQSILDVGSGEGHFIDFLRNQKRFSGKYTGIELLSDVHNKAVELYGNYSHTEFLNEEFLSYNFQQKKFDWSFSLGSLGVKQIQQEKYDLANCRKMINLVKYGISIFLNDISKIEQKKLEQFPDLAVHDIPKFVSMLKEDLKVSKVEVIHFPTNDSRKTMIHATK